VLICPPTPPPESFIGAALVHDLTTPLCFGATDLSSFFVVLREGSPVRPPSPFVWPRAEPIPSPPTGNLRGVAKLLFFLRPFYLQANTLLSILLKTNLFVAQITFFFPTLSPFPIGPTRFPLSAVSAPLLLGPFSSHHPVWSTRPFSFSICVNVEIPFSPPNRPKSRFKWICLAHLPVDTHPSIFCGIDSPCFIFQKTGWSFF